MSDSEYSRDLLDHYARSLALGDYAEALRALDSYLGQAHPVIASALAATRRDLLRRQPIRTLRDALRRWL